jgi:hypothetical protein
MSAKPGIPVTALIDRQCQHISPKGRRCHMLIDENHRPPNGTKRPALCAHHAARLKASLPVVDPEVLAAELLRDVDNFTTADEVNIFLGNLVKQLARKRISRRDAIAMAYIGQLLLNSLTAMAKEDEAERHFAGERSLFEGRLRVRTASSVPQPSSESALPAQSTEHAPCRS